MGVSALTLGVNSLPANELSQTLWVDLFPWLDDDVSDRAALLEPLAPSPDLVVQRSAVVHIVPRGQIYRRFSPELASLYIAHHAAAVLQEQTLPLLGEDLPLEALSLDTRTMSLHVSAHHRQSNRRTADAHDR